MLSNNNNTNNETTKQTNSTTAVSNIRRTKLHGYIVKHYRKYDID